MSIWHFNKRSNIHVISILEEEKPSGAEKVFREIMAKNTHI